MVRGISGILLFCRHIFLSSTVKVWFLSGSVVGILSLFITLILSGYALGFSLIMCFTVPRLPSLNFPPIFVAPVPFYFDSCWLDVIPPDRSSFDVSGQGLQLCA